MIAIDSKTKPNLEDWQELYQAAIAFKQLSCWKWLNPDHLFGIQNPTNGEIGYCCVIGELGEVLALNVYSGAKGLAGFLRIQQTGSSNGFLDVISMQQCIMASFDDRNQLEPSSLKLIKELGLKFRGSQAWPNFQSFEPGYVPWGLTMRDEVRFLTTALLQTTEVASRYKHRTDELFTRDSGEIMVLVPQESSNGSYTWNEVWMLPPGIEEALMPDIPNFAINEIQIARVQKNVKIMGGVWEIDAFFVPMPIDDKPRPYFPQLALCVDQQSGQILRAELSKEAGSRSDLSQELLAVVNIHEVLPEGVYVNNQESFIQLKPLMDKLRIPLVMVDELPQLQEAKDNLIEHFSMM